MTDQVLVEVIKELKHLRYLNLYALSYLKCDFLKFMAEFTNETQLEFLDLCGNQLIDDDIFILFENSNSLQNLNYLNLSWCVNVTDKSFDILSKKLNKLQLLSLHGLLGITDRTIDHLSFNLGIFKSLITLDINGCKNIINRDETYLKSKFQNIKCFKYHF